MVVLTVRIGMEWVMGSGHISWGGRATGAGVLRTQRRPPSRMTRSRPRIAQNTCVTTDWCGLRSISTDEKKKQKNSTKWLKKRVDCDANKNKKIFFNKNNIRRIEIF